MRCEILWNFEMKMSHLISGKKADPVIIQKKKYKNE